MGLKCITAPTALPVTLAEAKAHCKVEFADDDALLEGLIASAVEAAQLHTGRQLVTAQFDFTLDAWPACTRHNPRGGVELPLAPLQTIDGVFYLDPDGVEQQLLSGSYVVDDYSLVPRLFPLAGSLWPALAADTPNPVRIRFTCGWAMEDGVSPPAWLGPPSIQTWLKVRVATLYEQREALVAGQTVAEVPRAFVDGLLDPFVIPKVV